MHRFSLSWKNNLSKILSTILVLVATAGGGLARPVSSVAGCHEVEVVFARGSGQDFNDTGSVALQAALAEELGGVGGAAGSGVDYGFYELGTVSWGGYQYPAVSVAEFDTLLGAKISAGKAFSYGKSVKQGVGELRAYVTHVAKNCPETKFALAGYSQGAQVVSTALPDFSAELAERILYAGTFGDPKLYLPEGFAKEGAVAPACLGQNFSNYRVYVPDCEVAEGILNGTIPYQAESYVDKMGAWCNAADFMCGSYFDFSALLAGHTAYPKDGSYAEFARKVAELARSDGEDSGETSEDEELGPEHAVALLIFYGYAEAGYHEEIKELAYEKAEEILTSGRELIIFTNSGREYNLTPKRQNCAGSCSLSDVRAAFSNLDNQLLRPELGFPDYGYGRKSVLAQLGWGEDEAKYVISISAEEVKDSSGTAAGMMGLGAGFATVLEAAGEPVMYVVVVEGAVLGLTEEAEPEFVDLPEGAEVKMIPVYANGRRGAVMVKRAGTASGAAAEGATETGKVTPKAPNSGVGGSQGR